MKKRIVLLIAFCSLIARIDAQQIKSVKIGDQVWMASNLNVSVPGSWNYNDNAELGKKYGRLYTWEAAKNSCPAGWHLPSQNEWGILIEKLGGEDKAGKFLRAEGENGFKAVLGGLTDVSNFRLLNNYGAFWTSTSYSSDSSWFLYITSSNDIVTTTFSVKSHGLSVRCLKNK